MKKKFLIALPLMLVVSIFSSCSSEDILEKEDYVENDIYSIYNKCFSRADYNYKNIIYNVGSRGDNDCEYLLDYLLSLSEEEFSELKEKLCDDVLFNEDRDSIFNERFDELVEETSNEEVVAYINFVNRYAQMGGHSVEFIEENTVTFCPKIMHLSVLSAALFDRMISPEFLGQNGSRALSCRDRLALECGGMLVEHVLVNDIEAALGLETDDPGFMLIGCTEDVADIVKALESYRICEKRGYWI